MTGAAPPPRRALALLGLLGALALAAGPAQAQDAPAPPSAPVPAPAAAPVPAPVAAPAAPAAPPRVPVQAPGAAPAAPAAPPPDVSVTAELLAPDGQPVTREHRLRLGDVASLVVTVRGPKDVRWFVPTNPALDRFRLAGDLPPTERREEGGAVVEVHRFPVMPLRVGAEKIPPLEVVWQRGDGASGTVATERLRARVEGRLANEQDPALAPAPPPVPVITTNWALVWALSVLGAVIATALLTLVALRLLRGRLQAAAPPPPPRPANEVALEALAWLERAELSAPERYARAVDVLRAYLGGRFGFDGMELTTRELMDALAPHVLEGGVTRTEVRALLEDADLVKFAKLTPTDEEARALIPPVRTIVERTWRPPEPEAPVEEAPARPRLEPASAVERVQAGALDVLLAAAVGLLVLGALWALGQLAWGWLGVLAAGAVLLVRDAAGPGSPGKALLGLRLVGRDEAQAPPSLGRRLRRNALLLVAPVGVPLEALVLVYHPLRHRLGDQWARTEVVRGGRR